MGDLHLSICRTSRERATYGGYGQLSCVREQESPCVLRIVALAVLPRRFPVLWFVHTWWLQSAAAAALTIRATQVMSELRVTTQFLLRSQLLIN